MQRALAPHGIVVRHRFPGASLGSSRCERPRSGYHGISPWKASARSALVQHERVAFRLALGGCMTSCALRLRKPHRTNRTSGALCRAPLHSRALFRPTLRLPRTRRESPPALPDTPDPSITTAGLGR
jgi:hypothetical protein